jgi:hypothetical protein
MWVGKVDLMVESMVAPMAGKKAVVMDGRTVVWWAAMKVAAWVVVMDAMTAGLKAAPLVARMDGQMVGMMAAPMVASRVLKWVGS